MRRRAWQCRGSYAGLPATGTPGRRTALRTAADRPPPAQGKPPRGRRARPRPASEAEPTPALVRAQHYPRPAEPDRRLLRTKEVTDIRPALALAVFCVLV